ncbi:4-phosphopantetheinyl transferase [Streptomyces venezuelae]|uniref:4'-phosphopantetheinyl transferase family protein n=1 Tax=Streptomyces venezuelae TaxID=54571 RepID=UPI00123CA8C1|nr:4'-phosphopantetheinyl transferase superfamily protein [Streptomyces venezuelae]QES12236.1 4-phosphopantetheinyl transferase [Streptomyces venezuelae]
MPLLRVADDELHLWTLRPPPTGSAAADALATGELDGAERRRAEAYVRPRDRVQYLAAHLALRRVLARYTGVPAGRLRFGREAAGRPVLLGVAGPPSFSLSHSHGLVLLGVARRPVGVDVQRVPPYATAEVCRGALHPAEREELAALPDDRLAAAFARLWTRKEAYLKGLGTGLARGLATDFLGTPGHGGVRRPVGWTVLDLPGGPDHAAAAALRGDTAPRVTTRALRPEDLTSTTTDASHDTHTPHDTYDPYDTQTERGVGSA